MPIAGTIRVTAVASAVGVLTAVVAIRTYPDVTSVDAGALAHVAITAGALALLLALVAVWLITRPLLRRLRKMAEVASFVGSYADGDNVLPEAIAVEIERDDELGALGRAFNDMLGQVRSRQTRLRDAVADLKAAESKLELRFERRKQSLKNVNRQLRNEMDRRTKIELELRQAQKLESVGRLAAGIAHEINTPIQFVSDSCSFLQSATADLMTVIAATRSLRCAVVGNEITIAEALQRVRAAEAEADLDYLLAEIPQAIERSLQGLERVATIVKSMKEFAHPDQAQEAYADLNRAITSTITVARNEYKYVADLETDLADLPPVSCHVGELNQFVLNIVVNAAHAIEAAVKDTDRRGKIVVRTATIDRHAVIEITDDGCGIPNTHLEKIFDPFFTTKEIGKGTGQGLAIARSVIVDKHHGRLTVESELGRGTTFRIWLPVDHAARGPLALVS
ncbi:hypothetical protein BH11MYX3_BH11MYX3_26410 [soil metagenome]